MPIIKPKTWEEYYTLEELMEMRQPEFMDKVEAIVKRGAIGLVNQMNNKNGD